ncbi:MAG: GAF domain-containing protein [Chloroflexi bacterium]|nr:GAF domain-containing protein [Chloroflexota bacterium]
MNREENLERQLRQLEDRVSKLSQAVIRISESPDLNEVLERVLEGARDLTGADYSLITTEDDSKGLDDFMVSGITPDEAGRLWNTPGGMAMKKHLDAIQRPHRVDDFPAYAESMGFHDFSMPVRVGASMVRNASRQTKKICKQTADEMLAALDLPVFEWCQRVRTGGCSKSTSIATFTSPDPVSAWTRFREIESEAIS